MNINCPYCKQPMPGEMVLPHMRPRWMRIYRAVLESGPDGIAPDDLLVRMYGENEWPTPGGFVVLRVSIHDMNKKLEPFGQRIVNEFRGNYRIVSTKISTDEEKAHSKADH